MSRAIAFISLMAGAATFPYVAYNPVPETNFLYPGANSNSFAWWDLTSVGLNLGAPPNAPGFPGSNLFQ